MPLDPERIAALKALIAAYEREHNFDRDPDIESTFAMLALCKYIVQDLEGGKSESVPDSLPW